jgi:hypothetical protein
MAKTEVCRWRIFPQLKSKLEEQERLQVSAMRFVGAIQSGQSQRAENARSEVRSRIARQHDR